MTWSTILQRIDDRDQHYDNHYHNDYDNHYHNVDHNDRHDHRDRHSCPSLTMTIFYRITVMNGELKMRMRASGVKRGRSLDAK